MEDAGTLVAITQRSLRDGLPTVPNVSVFCIEESATSPSAPPVAPDGDAPACLLYPDAAVDADHRGVVTHLRLAALVDALIDRIGLGRADVVLSGSPAPLDVAAIELLAPLTLGARLIMPDGDVLGDAEELSALATSSGATLMLAPASSWRSLLRADSRSWPALRAVCVGAVPERDLVVDLVARTAGVWIAHGAAQAGVWATLTRNSGAEPRPILGLPLPGTHVRLIGADLQEVPLGAEGELWIADDTNRRRGAASGTNPRVAMVAGDAAPFYRSGERARWRSDHTLEWVEGRADRPASTVSPSN